MFFSVFQSGGCNTYCDHGESYRPAFDKLKKIEFEGTPIDGNALIKRVSAEYTGVSADFVAGYNAAFRDWNKAVREMMEEKGQ